MKSIPCYTHEAQGILDGRQSQLRRVVKPQPYYVKSSGRWVWDIPKSKILPGCCQSVCTASREWWEYLLPNQFPYQPGDILWVRETWGMLYGFAPGEWERIFPDTTPPDKSDNLYCYKADFSKRTLQYLQEKGEKWRPSIHMPREAARIFLRITDVRVERVQEITDGDCRKEGIKIDYTYSTAENYQLTVAPEFIDAFHTLWDSLNAKRGYGWDTNPWVWVYTFERIDSPTAGIGG